MAFSGPRLELEAEVVVGDQEDEEGLVEGVEEDLVVDVVDTNNL